jgi:hypothetical protein
MILVDFAIVSENFGMEILKNLNLVKKMFKDYFPLNFVAVKLKDLLADKS